MLGAATDPAIRIAGYSHLALLIADRDIAREFYCDVLGFRFVGTDILPGCERHIVVATASDQLIALCDGISDPALADTGAHQAFRVSENAREEIVARLNRRGVGIHRYKEDRAAEDTDNLYFYDPFGNRLQLVSRRSIAPSSTTLIEGIDHAAVQAIDVEWEEKFYVGHLGLPIDQVVGWRTSDYVRARLWGEGKEEMAPGTRRWDKRYNVMHGKDPVPRPNAQLFVRLGDQTLGIYLADKHFQEPPEEVLVGAPRLAFTILREDMERLAERLSDWGPTVGPVQHPPSALRNQSIYFKDPGSNFLEFCCR
jgi:catechol 2,3-dioxygenase-like lactoylglutathione lyase family enzyme